MDEKEKPHYVSGEIEQRAAFQSIQFLHFLENGREDSNSCDLRDFAAEARAVVWEYPLFYCLPSS